MTANALKKFTNPVLLITFWDPLVLYVGKIKKNIYFPICVYMYIREIYLNKEIFSKTTHFRHLENPAIRQTHGDMFRNYWYLLSSVVQIHLK